ncbi:hypothetical protein E2C01_079627 [Portunus trituberculatus]|uniref:Uncharacterized protein n=1 Tax=Portunus trituberculatus TaxID=210409 RepID=A0A5B7IT97_PORTR|nr:hypothetical protein [Portunus trituberculatus]
MGPLGSRVLRTVRVLHVGRGDSEQKLNEAGMENDSLGLHKLFLKATGDVRYGLREPLLHSCWFRYAGYWLRRSHDALAS